MSRALSLSLHTFSAVEKWLLEQSIEKIDSATLERIRSTANVGWKVTVTAQDYATKFGVDTHTASEQLKLATDSLFRRSVRYQTRDRRGTPLDHRLHWITSITETHEGDRRRRNDTFRINFSPEVVSFLVNPGGHTSINEPDPETGIGANNSPTVLPAELRLPPSWTP